MQRDTVGHAVEQLPGNRARLQFGVGGHDQPIDRR